MSSLIIIAGLLLAFGLAALKRMYLADPARWKLWNRHSNASWGESITMLLLSSAVGVLAALQSHARTNKYGNYISEDQAHTVAATFLLVAMLAAYFGLARFPSPNRPPTSMQSFLVMLPPMLLAYLGMRWLGLT